MTAVLKWVSRNLTRRGHLMMMTDAHLVTNAMMAISTFFVRIEECLRGPQIATERSKAMASKMPDSMHCKL